MSSVKSHSQQREREYFASPFTVAATVGAVIFFLYLIFPKQSLLEMLAVPRHGDPLVRSYLSSLLQISPGDGSLRLMLARQEMSAGNNIRAGELVSPFLEGGESPYYWEALRLTYEMTVKDAFSHKEGSRGREEGLLAVADLLDRMTEGPWQEKELASLADDAVAYGNAGAAIAFRSRLATLDKSPSSAAKAAEVALSLGDYRRSAEFYFVAQSREPGIDGKRKWFMAALKSLQSGNLLSEAMAEAQKNLDGLADDRETLLYLARLALAARRGDLAESYIKRLLRFGG